MTNRFEAQISTEGGAIIIFDSVRQIPIYRESGDGYRDTCTYKTLAAAKGQATLLNNRAKRLAAKT